MPTCVKEVCSFLGFANYYRFFILGFSHIAAPLHELTKKGVKFQWSSQCQDACDKVKERLVSSPVLAYRKNDLMPLFHQQIKPRSCRRPLIVDSRLKNNKNGREYWVGTEVWD